MPRVFPLLFVIFSFIGFLDAAYLAANHYLGVSLVCIIVHGCDTVTGSIYSKLFGIPVALLGTFYYLSIFLLTVAFFDTGKRVFFDCARMCTVAGFMFSLWFLYVQAFLLGAYCIYCLGSVITSTLLFVIAILSYIGKRSIQRERLEDAG
ncbi:vitamin K epoxide reductase family protein [Candidatus Uhrbacteria bacterium]|nr:vitamin K epoxide reductase family protein [Candidatus Uhrbacteria bacterium]